MRMHVGGASTPAQERQKTDTRSSGTRLGLVIHSEATSPLSLDLQYKHFSSASSPASHTVRFCLTLELSFLISAPSLGVYYCQLSLFHYQLTLSVCPSVTKLQIDSSFLFLDKIEPFFGRQFSMTPLRNVFFDF